MKRFFITGIDTGIGKTIVSAIVTEKLQADYWKPIQSGDLDNSDTLTIKQLVANPVTVFHPEAYRLTQPFSPHKSAAIDGIQIDPDTIRLPQTTNSLVVEGAGGLMVPLNEKTLIIDLIKKLELEVILVAKNYLGSINHTLLSLEMLRLKHIPLAGIVFNGPNDSSSENYILNYSKAPLLGRVPNLETLSHRVITDAGKYISLS
ncbi:dethiobiotin synthase [Pedobacter sp. BS3]|uniref:dethiobiotin synthase n=1 Tax=Pedobacter sp. BS3 TaxID=2567937 RepID=UPI0011EFC2B5|nr:dethiobiotin synthase [Pedobacter sp. BS3]TZF84482.1 dethiobiotin synthase [Pedobacter sp. BS3]